jgi:hypothetical protein
VSWLNPVRALISTLERIRHDHKQRIFRHAQNVVPLEGIRPEQTGTDEADVLRRAIALLKVVKDGQERGESPALVGKDGTITTTITGV